MTEPGRTEWGARIRRERERRSWSQADAVAQLRISTREHHGVELVDDDSLLRSWKRWEAGGGIRADYQRYLATLFESVPGALFPPAQPLLLPPTGDVSELLQQLQASSVDDASLHGIALTVDRLCSEYPYVPAGQLLIESRAWLGRLVQLTRQSMTLAQRREVQVQAGWLALLVACVQYDTGDNAAATITRAHALSLGHEAGHAEIQGWAYEIEAWQALTSGNLGGVLTATQAGSAIAGNTSVAVQLAGQEAKALVRMARADEARRALEQGRKLLEPMPYPTNLAHHFVVDPAKFDFYRMDVHRIAGDDAAAQQLAHEVLAAGTSWDGTEHAVMRNAEARVTLGTVAARQGDIEGAAEYGLRALSSDRRSIPSLLMVARDLTAAITKTAPNAGSTLAYLEQLNELRRPS